MQVNETKFLDSQSGASQHQRSSIFQMITTTHEEADEQGESSSRSEEENADTDEEEKTPVFTDNGQGVKTLQ